MGPIHSLDDVVDMLHRRAFLLLIVIGIGACASLWLALSQPRMFTSSEVIQIVPAEIADEPGTAAQQPLNWDQRLRVIEQRLLARDNLVGLIDEFGLYLDQSGLRSGDKVAQLRQSIEFRGDTADNSMLLEGAMPGRGALSKLTIQATLPTPDQAQGIAHEIAKQVIELSSILRIGRAHEALDFVLLQEEKLTARIDILQSRISAFQNADTNSATGSARPDRYGIVAIESAISEIDHQSADLHRALDQIDETILSATTDQKRARLQLELENLRAQKTVLVRRKQLLLTIPQDQRELASAVRELEQLRTQLRETMVQVANAETNFRLESQHQLERLSVLELAQIPQFPVKVPRIQMALIGIVTSILVAIGLALSLEWRNRAVRSARQMQRELGYAPIASIPRLDGPNSET